MMEYPSLQEFTDCAEMLKNGEVKNKYHNFEEYDLPDLKEAMRILYYNPQRGFDVGSQVLVFRNRTKDKSTRELEETYFNLSYTAIRNNIKYVLDDIKNIYKAIQRNKNIEGPSLELFCYKHLEKATYNPIFGGVGINLDRLSVNDFVKEYTYSDIKKFNRIGDTKAKMIQRVLQKYGFTMINE